MNTDSQADTDHESISLLLPWWVNKTLDQEDQIRVANHLKVCDSCQMEVDHLSSMSVSINSEAQDHYEQHADSQADLARVMQRIDQETSNPLQQVKNESLATRIVNAISSAIAPGPIRQWAAPAVVALLVVTIGSQLWLGQDSDDYSVLSSNGNSDSGMQVSVHFTPDTTAGEVSRIFSEYSNAVEGTLKIVQIDNQTYTVGYDDSSDTTTLLDSLTWLKEQDNVDTVDVMR